MITGLLLGLIVTVTEELSTGAVGEVVGDFKGVGVFLFAADEVGVAVLLIVLTGVAVPLTDIFGVRESTRGVHVVVGDAERVLLPPVLRVPVTDAITVRVSAALPVFVFVAPELLEVVGEAEPLLDAALVRVVDTDAVAVLEAVTVEDRVGLLFIVPVSRGEAETLAEGDEVLEALVDPVLVAFAVAVLLGATLRDVLGELVIVLELLEEPVAVLEPVVVFVAVVVEVIVCVSGGLTVRRGVALAVLEEDTLRVPAPVGGVLLVEVVLGVSSHVGLVLRVAVVVLVDVLEVVGLSVVNMPVSARIRG